MTRERPAPTPLHAVDSSDLVECPTCHEGLVRRVPPKHVRFSKFLSILLLDIELQLVDDPKGHPRKVEDVGPPYRFYHTAEGPTWGSVFIAGLLSAGASFSTHIDSRMVWTWILPGFIPVAWLGIYLKRWLKSAIERSRE